MFLIHHVTEKVSIFIMTSTKFPNLGQKSFQLKKKFTFSWSRNRITTVSTGLNSSNCLDTLRPASTLKVLRYSWLLPIISKNCQILSSKIGKNRQILLRILSNVVKSCETLSNENNGDSLSIIPCDFNDGRVSHVDQEVGEGYLPTDESRNTTINTNTTNANTTMQS